VSDPTPTPVLAALAGASAAPAAAPVAATPAPEVAEAPAKPRALNPWAKRAAAAPAPAAPTPAPEPAADPRLAALTSQVDALRGVLSRQAETELAGAPENVRKYVLATAGDDPAKRLDALHALRAAGLATAPASVPQGATTLPASAPAPAATPANTDAVLLDHYNRLRETSPIVASAFATANREALARARAARN